MYLTDTGEILQLGRLKSAPTQQSWSRAGGYKPHRFAVGKIRKGQAKRAMGKIFRGHFSEI